MTGKSFSKQNKVFALAALGYIAFLYGTLGVTPYFFRWFRATAGKSGYSWSITLLLMGCGLMVLILSRRSLLPLSPLRLLGLAGVLGGYGLIFWLVRIPAVRLHTMQYGLFTWLVTRSLHGRLPLGWVYGWALLLVMAVAVGDESIQWFLPNRHGLLKDVLLDWFSAVLAQCALFLILDYCPPDRVPSVETA